LPDPVRPWMLPWLPRHIVSCYWLRFRSNPLLSAARSLIGLPLTRFAHSFAWAEVGRRGHHECHGSSDIDWDPDTPPQKNRGDGVEEKADRDKQPGGPVTLEGPGCPRHIGCCGRNSQAQKLIVGVGPVAEASQKQQGSDYTGNPVMPHHEMPPRAAGIVVSGAAHATCPCEPLAQPS